MAAHKCSLPIEEAVCSTSASAPTLAHGSGTQRPFSGGQADLGRRQRHIRSNQRRYTLLARADARSQDFQRAGLDFQRAAKLRLDQLVNRVQGYDTNSLANVPQTHQYVHAK